MIDNKELVENTLRKYPNTRDNDMLLYEYVMNAYGYSRLTSFHRIKELIDSKFLPAFDTISRIRRKLQETDNSLKSSNKCKSGRDKREQLFKDFSRGKAEIN